MVVNAFLNHAVGGVQNLISDETRMKLAKEGKAMPSGAYPIRNIEDLKRAIKSFGRTKNKTATKKWIIKRARALDSLDLLPESWKEGMKMEYSDSVDSFLTHYGVLGMKWGVRKDLHIRDEVKSDLKQLRRLNRQSRVGIVKERRTAAQRIRNRVENEPDYAEALTQINKSNRRKAIAIATAVTIGAYAVPSILSQRGSRKVSSIKTSSTSYNPKNSPLWNNMTIKGSATPVGTAMDLYRKFG